MVYHALFALFNSIINLQTLRHFDGLPNDLKLFWETGYIYEPAHEKTCLISYVNNKGADQPAHPRCLISAFVIRCLDSIIYLVSLCLIP